ncbi:MAG: heavy-metal-associated domain-containing protein [Candidatus Aenigmarchaeota archaeon]|nr:heavy-metal-associated domain-containing protein [Candidatus Aenigmarchaeota archaeon]
MNKTVLAVVLLAIVGILVLAFSSTNKTTKAVADSSDLNTENSRHLVLDIKGMYCPSCGPGIAKMYSETDGVVVAKVSRAGEKGEIVYDSTKTSKEQLLNLLEDPYKGTVVVDMPATRNMIEQVRMLNND